MAETLFISMLKTSLCVGIVGLVLCLLSAVLSRRYAAKWKYYIWLVLAVWLLVPVSISLPSAPVSVAVPAVEYALPPVERYTAADDAPAQTQPEALLESDVGTTEPVRSGVSPASAQAPARTVSLVRIAMLVWLVGALGFLIWHLGCYILLRQRLARDGYEPVRTETLSAFRNAVKSVGCGENVPLRIYRGVSGPMALGVFKPVVVLPGESYSLRDMEFILCHELTHLKRRDLWYKLLLLAANAVHWFNPAVYLIARSASADIELCCDDDVAKSLDMGEKAAYSETILAGAAARFSRRELLTTAFSGSKAQLRRRIVNILDAGKKHSGLVLLMVSVLTVGLMGGLVACSPAIDLTNDSIRIIDAEAESGGVRMELVSAMGDGLYNEFKFKVWLPEEAEVAAEISPTFGIEEDKIEFNVDNSGFSPSGGGYHFEHVQDDDGAYAFTLVRRCKYNGSDGGKLNDGTVRTLHLENLTVGETYKGVWDFDFEYKIPLDIREFAAAPVEVVFTNDYGFGETFGAEVTSFRLSNFSALCEFTLEDKDAEWTMPEMSVELKDGKSVALSVMGAVKGGKDVTLEAVCVNPVAHSEVKCVRLGDTLLFPDGKTQSAPAPEPEAAANPRYRTMLLAGLDAAGENTDMIMVARFDAEGKSINAVTLPRDTLVNTDSPLKRLGSVYGYSGRDVEALMGCAEDITGFDIDSYALLRADAFERIVDAVGGVYFDVPRDMAYVDDTPSVGYLLKLDIKKGYQLLNGHDALGVCQYRSGYPGGDIDRIAVQQDFIKAAIPQILNLGNVGKSAELVGILRENLTTSLSLEDVQWFVTRFLTMNADNLSLMTLPTETAAVIGGIPYLPIAVDDWMVMLNASISPYDREIAAWDCAILRQKETQEPVGSEVTADSFALTNGAPVAGANFIDNASLEAGK